MTLAHYVIFTSKNDGIVRIISKNQAKVWNKWEKLPRGRNLGLREN